MSMPRDDLPYCDCGWLERAAHDPACPVDFDSELNEYHLRTSDGGKMLFYHCPFCAGRAPESLRDQMFATVSPDETTRLHALTKDLKTEEEVLAALGEPTYTFEPGVTTCSQAKDDAPEIETARSLRYDQHSDTATINVTVGRHGRVRITFSGKYVGKKKAG